MYVEPFSVSLYGMYVELFYKSLYGMYMNPLSITLNVCGTFLCVIIWNVCGTFTMSPYANGYSTLFLHWVRGACLLGTVEHLKYWDE